MNKLIVPPEHVNCKCMVERGYDPTSIYSVLEAIKNDLVKNAFTPVRILKNADVTIVFWVDGTKTVVRPEPGATPDDYTAFTAALAKKVFGSNSKLKKVIKTHTEYQVHKCKCKDACDIDLKEVTDGEVVPTSGSST